MVALRELMNPNVVAVTPGASIADAAAQMVKAKVGSAVVMQGTFLAGIITERDVMRAAASGSDLTSSTVAEWMTPDPHSADPDSSAEDAAQLMMLYGFRHMPVVEGRRVCGVVSLREIFAARIRR